MKKAPAISHNTFSELDIPVPVRDFRCDSSTPQLRDFVDKERSESKFSTCFNKVPVKHYPKRIFDNNISFVECCIFNDINSF